MKKSKSNWVVKMKCVVVKDVFLEDCSKSEAINNPYDYAIDETERYQQDWEVISVEENI